MLALAACSPIYVDWDKKNIRSVPVREIKETSATPASAPKADAVTASHKETASTHPRRTHHQVEEVAPEMTIEPDMEMDNGTGAVTTPSSSDISMVAPGDSSGLAQKSLDLTSRKLGSINRNRLHGSALATFDQANGFLLQGRQALVEKDYVAASGFAQKASVLADKLHPAATATTAAH